MKHQKISFTKKPLQDLSADILFSYTNTDFLPQAGGVYEALVSADPTIAIECAGANIKLGTALISGPGKLSYTSVCHFAIAGIGNDPTEISIRNAMRYGFQVLSEPLAKTGNLPHSFVFPAISVEAGGMPCAMCAEIILREVLIFAENKFVEKIQISAPNNKTYSQYSAVLKTMLKK